MGKLLTVFAPSSSGTAPAVAGDVTAITIKGTGNQGELVAHADITIKGFKDGGAYSFDAYSGSPKIQFNVVSKSWDSSGNQTTINRTVLGYFAKRLPWNQQTTKDETEIAGDVKVRVVLTEKIYTGETFTSATFLSGWYTDNGAGGSGAAANAGMFSGTITNSSTWAYPKAIPLWINHDLDWVTTSSYVVNLAVAHGYAQSGQSVRAVKFTATDEHSHSTSVTVSTMTGISWSASGKHAPVFQGTLDFSGLDNGDMITIDATIYPWVGDAYQSSVDGSAYPSPNHTVLKVLNDRTGAYGTAYAYVDTATGNDTTGVANATAATAALLPCATIAGAASKLQTYINSTYSRNNVSGGIIRLNDNQTHIHSTYSARAVGAIPLIIEATNSSGAATTVYQDAAVTTPNSICDYLKIKNIKLRKHVGAGTFLDSAAAIGDPNMLVLENVIFDINGHTNYAGWIYKPGRHWLINCSGDAIGQSEKVGLVSKKVIAIGNNIVGVCQICAYSAIGNNSPSSASKNSSLTQIIADAGREAGEGQFFGWNFVATRTNGTNAGLFNTGILNSRGLAVVGNVFEQSGGITAPCFTAWADSIVFAVENFVEMQNTVVGSRSNRNYQDTGSATVSKRGYFKASLHFEINTKTDIFATNANCVGNWSQVYGQNVSYDSYLRADSNAATNYGVGLWIGEVKPIGNAHGTDATPLVTNFVNDASSTSAGGSGLGNGNYKPQSGNNLATIPGAVLPYPIDQLGATIPTNGTAVSGAIQV